MTNSGNETRPLPLPIHLNAADMTILNALVKRPATPNCPERLTWLVPSQIYLVVGHLAIKLLEEQSGGQTDRCGLSTMHAGFQSRSFGAVALYLLPSVLGASPYVHHQEYLAHSPFAI